MELLTEDVAKGLHIGEYVWICDYRYLDFAKNPIRHIPPTKCLIRSEEETSKICYYSDCFFSPVSKKSGLTKKIIHLFDNTGYKSNTGTPLKVFTQEKECREYYAKRCADLYKDFYNYKKALEEELDARLTQFFSKKEDQLKYLGNKVDLRTCKKGDILISSLGERLKYVRPTTTTEYLDHVIEYPDGSGGTRTHDGKVFPIKPNPETDHDIVEIVRELNLGY
jgi:hypothetical protein